MGKRFAYINGAQLTWARERRGWTIDHLAGQLPNTTNEHILAWEQGTSYPAFGKAEKLATLLHIPFGYLFAEKPPVEDLPLPDLRTLPGTPAEPPSTNFLELLYSVAVKHDWYKGYLSEHGARDLPFVSAYGMNDDPAVVAANIRETVLVNENTRFECHSRDAYLSRLVRNAESAGIVVLRSGVVRNNNTRPLSVGEFQGFAITDRIAPLIFINAKDFVNAKIFTLAHELVHIWIGVSGISNADESQTLDRPHLAVEDFCNTVAAEVLVPRAELRNRWRRGEGFQQIERLAGTFKVSTIVTLRRAGELGLVTADEFRSFLPQARHVVKPRQKSDGGSFYNTEDARHSPTLMQAVYDDVRSGNTSYREGASLLDVRVPTFEHLMEGSAT